jgi:hypothetical protein
MHTHTHTHTHTHARTHAHTHRVDVLLKADQPVGRYWISGGCQLPTQQVAAPLASSWPDACCTIQPLLSASRCNYPAATATTNQPLPLAVGSQYRKGAPATYGVLRYEGSTSAPNPDTIVQVQTDKRLPAATCIADTLGPPTLMPLHPASVCHAVH